MIRWIIGEGQGAYFAWAIQQRRRYQPASVSYGMM
jgi:hypothetical protein